MGMRIAICQCGVSADAGENLKRMEGCILREKADLYVFPELYLSGYGNPDFSPDDAVTAESRLRILCNERDVAVAFGTPMQWYNGVTNSMLFVTPEETYRYDKMYLANFPPYDESSYSRGNTPVMVEWKGMKIGLEICYDLMFPEVHRFYATHGADMVIAISASTERSRKAMQTVLPARSLEETVYTLYCNCVGDYKDTKLFGGSALYSPLGEVISQAGDGEETLITFADNAVVEHARTVRHHLQDLRSDIRWIL